MEAKFIGNTKTKTLHVLAYTDGRCKVDQIRTEQRKEFMSLEEALTYPEGEKPIFHECGICFRKMRKAKEGNEK